MLSLQSRALNSMQSPLPQADGPVGRQARALGQDAAGRRYYLLGGDMGTTRVFVDSGPAAEHTALGTAGDDELVGAGMQRISSFASDIQGSGVAAPQQPQQSAPLQQLSNPTDPAEGAWGWYEADQLPALLEWLEGGDEGERALADALFEAMLPLLPASLASTAPSQARTNSFARTETELCLPWQQHVESTARTVGPEFTNTSWRKTVTHDAVHPGAGAGAQPGRQQGLGGHRDSAAGGGTACSWVRAARRACRRVLVGCPPASPERPAQKGAFRVPNT